MRPKMHHGPQLRFLGEKTICCQETVDQFQSATAVLEVIQKVELSTHLTYIVGRVGDLSQLPIDDGQKQRGSPV